MKKLFLFSTIAIAISTISTACAQKPSPAATAKGILTNGNEISINYSSPAVKGRTIGKDVEPMQGKIWRAGANDATVFEITKDATINGKPLPAGKYGFFTLDNGSDWTIIFNKTFKQWGAFSYDKNKDKDVASVTVPVKKMDATVEQLTIRFEKNKLMIIEWAETQVTVPVKPKD